MKKEIEGHEVFTLAYDFIDDSLMPDKLKEHFKNNGIDLKTCNIRREDGVLKLIVDEYKFHVVIEREK